MSGVSKHLYSEVLKTNTNIINELQNLIDINDQNRPFDIFLKLNKWLVMQIRLFPNI